MRVALFARATLAACLLSFVGIACADPKLGAGPGDGGNGGDETVSPDLVRATVRLCAQADGLEYTNDLNECDFALTSPEDAAAVCEQARAALDEALVDPGHGRNKIGVIRKIVEKTCGGA